MARRVRLSLLALALAGLSLADPAVADARECRYTVVVSDASASELTVTIDCDGGLPPRFTMKSGAAGWAGTMNFSNGSSAEAEWDGWSVPSNSRDGTAHYRMALGAMANASGTYNAALKVGNSVLVKLDSWLAMPSPSDDYELAIAVAMPEGGDVAASLTRDGDVYRVAARELRRAGFFVFGTFQRAEIKLPAPRALATGASETTLATLVVLGRPMKTQVTDLKLWVEYSGLAAAEFWRGFPMENPLFVVLPEGGDGISQGRVIPGVGVTTMLHIGHNMQPAGLYADDVLIHEMLHLGSPSIEDRGDWLNEGVATLYEPIIRMRAGWIERDDVWREWMKRMPSGLEAMREVGLEEAEGSDIYWGGAFFLLLAEIEVRQRTGLRLGIEDCLRAVRDAGGTMAQDWTTQKFIDLCDKTLGGTTMKDLAAKHLGPGTVPNLNALWAQLGVSAQKDGTIVFNDKAPLAMVRDAILSGGPDATWQPTPRDPAWTPAPAASDQVGSAVVSGAAN